MPIYSVVTFNPYQIKTAYNYIQIATFTLVANPVIYVDVYFNGTYYKTISATSYDYNTLGFWLWYVDIKDAAQEYLKATVPALSTNPTQSQMINDGLVVCYVKVRGSAFNTSGYLVPDGPLPIQGTVDNAPSSGGGVTAYGNPVFFILNAALQLEEDPVTATNLAANNVGYVQAGYTFYNLFRNPRLTVTKNDYLRLPILIPHYGMSPVPTSPVWNEDYWVVIEDDQGGIYYPANPGVTPTFATLNTYFVDQIWYIPAGPKNFAGLQDAFGVWINWDAHEKYRILLVAAVAPTISYVRWKSPWIYLKKPCANSRRLQFVNWYGHYDTIVFERFAEDFKVSSEGWEQFNVHEFTGANKSLFGKRRYNIHANEVISLDGYFRESDMPFVKQLLMSPTVYIEMKGTAGQADYLLPVRLFDVSITTRKLDERYIYNITAQAEPANERIPIRN